LGYAPNTRNLLSNFLQARGYKMLDAQNAGLIANGRDRFFDRLMFPIKDTLGNVIAFTGRAMHQTEAGKYVNSPDSPIFNKSRVIYGLDVAKSKIKEKNQVIIVEGQTDVIAAHQNGFKNVVASSGTALTQYHLEILGRFTKKIAFCFDQDTAGEAATKKAIALAHQMDFDVKIILLPSGKDPDDVLRENPTEFERAVKNQKGALDYYFEISFKKYQGELNAENKREIAAELLPAIKNLSNQIVRSHYIQKLSEKLNVPEKYLYEALEKTKLSSYEIIPKPEPKNKTTNTMEERLLGIVLLHPAFQKDFINKIDECDFKNIECKELAKEIKKHYNENALFDVNSFKKKVSKKLAERIDFLILSFSENEDEDKDLLHQEFIEYISRLSTQNLESIKLDFENKIKDAEKTKNKEEVKKLIKEFQKAVIGR